MLLKLFTFFVFLSVKLSVISLFLVSYSSRMSYAEACGSHLAAAIKYRSLKFTTESDAKADDITRDPLLRVPLSEIEAIQQEPGTGRLF